jgi:hypothetical protein
MLRLQTTSGIYYSLVKEKGFDKPLGDAFEHYIGEVIASSLNPTKFSIIPEEVYGKPEKRTSDWTLMDSQSLMFIECKAKRLVHASKMELQTNANLDGDLKKMASFILQLYQNIIDWKEGRHPSLTFDVSLFVIPIVITLEDWRVFLDPKNMLQIDNFLRVHLTSKGYDDKIIQEHPYQIMSCKDFESHIGYIEEHGIKQYTLDLKDPNANVFHANQSYWDYVSRSFRDEFISGILKQ